MGFKLTPIDVVENISREDFYQNYLKPRRPVVIQDNPATGLPVTNGRWTI